jgi:hypothetical protein
MSNDNTDNYVQIAAYTVMANIGTDKQIEKCIENGQDRVPIYKLIFTCLMNEIGEIATKLEAGIMENSKEFEVHEMQFNDGGKCILCPIDVYKGQTLGGKLLALYNLAINKKAANLFFENIQPVALIIKHSKELEKRIGLRLLTQLCFYGSHAAKFLFEHGLHDSIKEMSGKEYRVGMLKKSIEHTEYAFQLISKHSSFVDIRQNEEFKRTLLKTNSFQSIVESGGKSSTIKHILVCLFCFYESTSNKFE